MLTYLDIIRREEEDRRQLVHKGMPYPAILGSARRGAVLNQPPFTPLRLPSLQLWGDATNAGNTLTTAAFNGSGTIAQVASHERTRALTIDVKCSGRNIFDSGVSASTMYS